METCSKVESLSIPDGAERTGVTSFVQEACHQVSILDDARRTLYSKQPDLQDLTHYLSRPVAITSGSLPTTRGMFYSQVVDDVTIYTLIPDLTLRLSGVQGFRASLIFTLQVSSTPFHQGLVAASFQYGISGVTPGVFSRGTHSATATNLPHVRLDLSTDTMVQLKVPFISTGEYFSFKGDGTTILGDFVLNNLTPAPLATGVSPPEFQLYLHLEDVELFGARPYSATTITFQSGRKAPTTAEFENEAYPYSSGLYALSRTARWISKGVPSISSIAGPASWFLEKTAGAIRSFGYSTPQVREPITRMSRMSALNEQNIDSPLAVSVVGPQSGNHLAVTPMFGGSDVDEMSLRHVLSQYSQIAVVQLPSSLARSNHLYAGLVTPSCMWFRDWSSSSAAPFLQSYPPMLATGSTTAFIPSGLFFFGSMFKFWRGSVKYRFTVVKTKMHGGRLMVNFTPSVNPFDDALFTNVSALAPVADYGNNGPNPFGYSAVYNLRDGNVFEFEVPYTSPKPYNAFSQAIGTISLHVVDALQAPATVPSAVHIVIEVCGGDDFELADYRGPMYPVHNNSPVIFQSGKVVSNAPEALSQYTIGECINSVKQLISIPKYTAFSVAGNSRFEATVPPWFYYPLSNSPGSPANNFFPRESFSVGGIIASCYTFVRGGTDFHAYATTNVLPSTLWMRIFQNPNTGLFKISNRVAANIGNSSACVLNESLQGLLHCRLPAFQHLVRFFSHSLNRMAVPGAAWSLADSRTPGYVIYPGMPKTFYNVLIDNQNSTTARFVSSRAASDDAALAMYNGPPPFALLFPPPGATGSCDPDAF